MVCSDSVSKTSLWHVIHSTDLSPVFMLHTHDDAIFTNEILTTESCRMVSVDVRRGSKFKWIPSRLAQQLTRYSATQNQNYAFLTFVCFNCNFSNLYITDIFHVCQTFTLPIFFMFVKPLHYRYFSCLSNRYTTDIFHVCQTVTLQIFFMFVKPLYYRYFSCLSNRYTTDIFHVCQTVTLQIFSMLINVRNWTCLAFWTFFIRHACGLLLAPKML
jgi:hypothetical protein